MNSLVFVSIGLILGILGFPLFIIGLIMLIIKAIRHKNKKPALVVMLVSVVLIIGGFSLSALDTDSMIDNAFNEAAKEKVEYLIEREYMGVQSIEYKKEEIKNNRYSYAGTFEADDYKGNSYWGSFEIVLEENGYNDDGSLRFDVIKSEISPAINQDFFD